MIKATEFHEITLATTDERTRDLANALHSMHRWHSTGLMTDDMFVHLHDVLRKQLDTENFLSAIQYADNREENNEYVLIVAEFPVKADGTIHRMKFDKEEDAYVLLTDEEAMFDAIQNIVSKKENN